MDKSTLITHHSATLEIAHWLEGERPKCFQILHGFIVW